MKQIKKAFTIVEILIALVIISIIFVTAFQTYTMILVGKVKLIERTKLEKEAFFFSEKLFQMIKAGGTIDYEEYFNRKVVEEGADSGVENGHYKKVTGFGNFGPGGTIGTTKYGIWSPYICLSGDDVSKKYNGENGCYNGDRAQVNNESSLNSSTGLSKSNIDVGQRQKYGQYAYQFWDYNANANEDRKNSDNTVLLGDEDGDGKVRGDDDDENLGMGPEVFPVGTNIHELYLLAGNKKQRTFFRWKYDVDPNAPSGETCDSNGDEHCLGTIQFLQLDGVDWGWDNKFDASNVGITENDGVIDTWLINKKFRDSSDCQGTGTSFDSTKDQDFVAGQFATKDCWKDLFPPSLNVSNFEVRAYPNRDQTLAWKTDPSEIVSPYVIISLELQPSWEINRKIRGKIPPLRFNTTVNLTDVFSK